jgi:glutathione peroxidase
MTVHDYSAKTIDGEDRKLSDYKGKVMVIVNTASKCGFTPQYKGLENVFREFRGRGLVVLGFPCDQFGHQEPGDENEIKKFCLLNYDVSFPMFSRSTSTATTRTRCSSTSRTRRPGFSAAEASSGTSRSSWSTSRVRW